MEGIKLSQIAKNPAVAAFFERGERDNGAAFIVRIPKQPVLSGGSAKVMEYA